MDPHAPATPVDFVVQHTVVTWTKRSRGAAGATVRNAVASGFPLPPAALAARGVHHLHHAERDDFAPTEEWHALPDPAGGRPPRWHDHDLHLRLETDALHVHLEPAAYGMPRRPGRPPAVRLRRGEWLRWQINARLHGDADGWWYRLDTYHVAVAPYAADVFLGTPTRRVDERAYLR